MKEVKKYLINQSPRKWWIYSFVFLNEEPANRCTSKMQQYMNVTWITKSWTRLHDDLLTGCMCSMSMSKRRLMPYKEQIMPPSGGSERVRRLWDTFVSGWRPEDNISSDSSDNTGFIGINTPCITGLQYTDYLLTPGVFAAASDSQSWSWTFCPAYFRGPSYTKTPVWNKLCRDDELLISIRCVGSGCPQNIKTSLP